MITVGSLFTGTSALEMGLEAALGEPTELVWYSEIDPDACRLLAHRFPGIPNLGDIATIDWSTVPSVHVLTGGFPCTDVSQAGLRLGLHPDTRSGLWSHMARAIDALQPRLVVIENVRGLLNAKAHRNLESRAGAVGVADDGHVLRALGAVLGDLSELGFDAEWTSVLASDVGAPHKRFRIFVLAYPADTDGEPRSWRWAPVAGDSQGTEGEGPADAGRRDRPAADTGGEAGELGPGLRPAETAGSWGRRPADGGLAVLAAAHPDDPGLQGAESAGGRDLPAWSPTADTGDHRCEGSQEPDGGPTEDRSRGGHPARRDGPDWGKYGPAVRRWEHIIGRPVPVPTIAGPRGGTQLNAELTTWMMGLPHGWITDVPGINNRPALRLCGNGCVPHQAAAAISALLDRVGNTP